MMMIILNGHDQDHEVFPCEGEPGEAPREHVRHMS